jgi:hypothetical protein
MKTYGEVNLFFYLVPPYSGARSHIGAQCWLSSFLVFQQAVRLLGRVISSWQDLCLNTGQHKHRRTQRHVKHPCPWRDLKPQTQRPRDRRLSMPQTARLPRPPKKLLAVICCWPARAWSFLILGPVGQTWPYRDMTTESRNSGRRKGSRC